MQYKIVDAASGKILGTGATEEAAIAAAALAMNISTQQHLSEMQLTPSPQHPHPTSMSSVPGPPFVSN